MDRKEDLIKILEKTFKESTLDQWEEGSGYKYDDGNIKMELYSSSLFCKIVDGKNELFSYTFRRGYFGKDPLGIKQKYLDKENQIEIEKREKAFQLVGVKEMRKQKLENLTK